MIDQESVWREIWPVAEQLLRATAAEDEPAVRRLLLPGRPAAVVCDLFGLPVFDILLKIVLGREQLGLARAIETEEGRYVHLELAWPDPAGASPSYAAADIVSVQLERFRQTWRVVDVNPATTDQPMTEAGARTILLAHEAQWAEPDSPVAPWVLPLALYAGTLQLQLREAAMSNPVERLLLPGLQERGFGLVSLVAGRRLWRDFQKKARPAPTQPAAWAAAAEFIMSEQTLRKTTQAAAGQQYQVSLPVVLSHVRQMKERLAIQGLDERYSPLGITRVVLLDRE